MSSAEQPQPSAIRIEPTPDGSATVWSDRYGQHYHNRNGALTQARHVFLQGTHTDRHAEPRVLEIGFGVGMNFLTTLADAAAGRAPLRYLAFEFDPLPESALRAIAAYHPSGTHPLWLELIECWPQNKPELSATASKLALRWGDSSVEIRFVDASDANFPPAWASAVYLDGFSPTANPELWTAGFIGKLAAAMQPGGWLATYSAAGAARCGARSRQPVCGWRSAPGQQASASACARNGHKNSAAERSLNRPLRPLSDARG